MSRRPERGDDGLLFRPTGAAEQRGRSMAVTRARRSTKKRSRQATARGPKYVYFFANGAAEGGSSMRALLGGKGCELAEMTTLGVPVPPGFTITTEAWAAYSANDRTFPAGLWEQVQAAMARLEGAAGLRFGDAARPLLV